MTTWDSQRMTCMHGVKEGLDYHECDECKKIAEAMGKTWIDKKETYIYLKLPKKLKQQGGKNKK